eukprot:COSAG01_NODE_5142_length_4457_cov_6.414410_4_plen_34_part_00
MGDHVEYVVQLHQNREHALGRAGVIRLVTISIS